MRRTFFLLSILLLVFSAEGQTYSVVHAFLGDGDSPVAELTLSENILYGTTAKGGSNDTGTIFKLNKDGTGFVVLKSLSATSGYPDYTNSDGMSPEAGLTVFGDMIYGTTRAGGNCGSGIVFRMKIDGSGFVVLKHFPLLVETGYFPTNSEGATPYSTLILEGNFLYGTTSQGGKAGDGTIFKITTNGTGFEILKDFSPVALTYYTNNDGAWPFTGLTYSEGTLYGTTHGGGILGGGTLFKLNTNGTGFTVLKNFSSAVNPDGTQPDAELTISGTTLYGIAFGGGSSNSGTIFKINTDGTDFTVIKNRSYDEGVTSNCGMTLVGNTLFGTSLFGGMYGHGVIFSVKTNGQGYSILKDFSPYQYPSDGINPDAGLLFINGILYGTTSEGGSGGTVFSLNLRTPLDIQSNGNQVVLRWLDPTLALQGAPSASGSFTNIPNAFSPYTNNVAGKQQFFRLVAN